MQLDELVRRGQIVKICGLREPVHAVAAAEAGADLLGFIFAPSRRQVTAQVARSCIDAARATNAEILAVGVFVDASAEEMRSIVELAGLDIVQFHGQHRGAARESPAVPTIRALRTPSGTSADSVIARIGEHLEEMHPPTAFHIDGYVAGEHGGTGVRADWDLARTVCLRYPVMLAGGLDPMNVGEAIRHVGPTGVDVSSGVEVDGAKNRDLIESFIYQARTAFQTLN